MKMSKLQFKSMLKECLSELINEGAFDSKIEKITEGKLTSFGVGRNSTKPSSSSSFGNLQEQPVNNNLTQTVQGIVQGISVPGMSKEMLAEIFMDTATGTLQKQLRKDKGLQEARGMGSTEGLLVGEEISPEEEQEDDNQLALLSGGGVSRWAKNAMIRKK